ncbi:MAG: ArnT family glycosyltransferase, partial [Anaerolineales bacterium]
MRAAQHRLSIILGALLTATLFRALPLTDNSFHPDEALYAYFARLIASGRNPLLAGLVVDKPPLPFYLNALSLALIGPTPFAARLPTFFASLISLALLYRLARRLYGPRVALLAAWLFALSPFAILFSITLFLDPLLTVFVLLGWWMCAEKRARAAALAFALAFAVKQTALFFIPLGLALALTRLPQQAQWRDAAREMWRLVRPVVIGLLIVFALTLAWDAARQPPIGVWTQGYADNAPNRLIRAGEVLPRAAAWLELLGYVTAST